MAQWKLIALPALLKMGIWGIGAVALLDSSTIPVPMDAVLAVYVWADKPHFWLYCLLASVGSAIGGLLRARFERQEFLAMLIPSMLPPPTPWKAFVFAAGVFEMRVLPFMLAVFCGRMIRWLLLSMLVLKLGPGAVDVVAHHGWRVAVLIGALALVGFAVWWWRKRKSGKLLED